MSKSKRNDDIKKIQHYVAKSNSFGVIESQQTQKNQPILTVDDIDNDHRNVENVENVENVKNVNSVHQIVQGNSYTGKKISESGSYHAFIIGLSLLHLIFTLLGIQFLKETN